MPGNEMNCWVTHVTLSLVFLCINCSQESGNKKVDSFKRIPCSDGKAEPILLAWAVSEIQDVRSGVGCAISCGRSDECNFAVYLQSINWCKLVNTVVEPFHSVLPSYSREQECVVLTKKQNPIPLVCRFSTWREMKLADFQQYRSFQQRKMIYTKDSTKTVYKLLSPLFHENRYYFQALNFLRIDVDIERFAVPLKREFMFISNVSTDYLQSNISLQTAITGMVGSVYYEADIDNIDVKLLVRNEIDDQRLIYEKDVHGSVSDLIESLSKGYRLLYNDYTRVGFDRQAEDVYFERVSDRVLITPDLRIAEPLLFAANKIVLNQEMAYGLQQLVSRARTRSHKGFPFKMKWEVDRCWTKYKSPGATSEMNEALRTAVLSGKEVMLIMEDSIVTDVVTVTTTKKDLVVVIADYLTPFDGRQPLNGNSVITFTLVSLSGRVVACEMKFEGPGVYSQPRTQIRQNLLGWVFSQRSWAKVFTISFDGSVLYGSRSELYAAAMDGKNIRVCVDRSPEETACYGSLTITLVSDNHVLVQTPAALETDLENGMFSGRLDTECKRSALLLSTKGTITKASFVIGEKDFPRDVVSENFLSMTWFGEY